MGSYRMCICFTRKFKITEADPPSDVKDAFSIYSDGAPSMSADNLRRFLQEVQGCRGDDAHRILEQVLQKRHHIAKDGVKRKCKKNMQDLWWKRTQSKNM